MPRCEASGCKERSTEPCIVCRSDCCITHRQAISSLGFVLPTKSIYCKRCYDLLAEATGTDDCYATDCEFITKYKCSVCQRPCCSPDHSLLEHVPTKENIEAQKINPQRICLECATKKHVKTRAATGGAIVGILIIIFVIWLLSAHNKSAA
jgi:hypothetical protein